MMCKRGRGQRWLGGKGGEGKGVFPSSSARTPRGKKKKKRGATQTPPKPYSVVRRKKERGGKSRALFQTTLEANVGRGGEKKRRKKVLGGVSS